MAELRVTSIHPQYDQISILPFGEFVCVCGGGDHGEFLLLFYVLLIV